MLVAIDGWGGQRKDHTCSLACRAPWRHHILKDERACYQRYDWDDDRLAEWHEVEPGGLLIAEGVSISRRELGDPWDIKVWIECPYELRLARGIERDGEAMRDVWVTQWIPEEERFVRDQRPHERADYIVLGYDTDGTRFIRP